MDLFDIWNNEKRNLNRRKLPTFYVNPREIWYTKMGKNIGFEQDGKKDFLRPVLVVKKIGNLFLTSALTSKGKSPLKYHHKLETVQLQNPKYKHSSYLILSQAKVVDKRRFIEKVGYVSKNEFNIIKEKLKTIMF